MALRLPTIYIYNFFFFLHVFIICLKLLYFYYYIYYYIFIICLKLLYCPLTDRVSEILLFSIIIITVILILDHVMTLMLKYNYYLFGHVWPG